jgi:hypothetical protein
MKNRSEGVRRITLLISFILSIAWVIFVFAEYDKPKGMIYKPARSAGYEINTQSSGFGAEDWIIFLVGFLIAFCLPLVINKVTYWIIEGFRKDKKSN